MEISKILKINKPEQIFSCMDENIIHKEYKKLIFEIHPDRNTDKKASEATAHINLLYKHALEKVKAGIWNIPNVIIIKSKTNQTFKMKYFVSDNFDLGTTYIGNKHIAYFIKSEWKKFFDNGVNFIKSFKFKSEKMKKEVSKYLPKIVKTIETIDGDYFLIIEKDEEMVRLLDLLNYMKNIDPKHTAWIMSSLHNLCCYFHIEGICHNDISLDTYYVSPSGHSGALYGGWWYSRRSGQKLIGVPKRTFQLMPSKQIASKIASRKLNLELIRDVGSTLLKNQNAPEVMINWMKMPPMKNAIEDYDIWYNKILTKSFGKHKFIKMDVNVKDIYKL